MIKELISDCTESLYYVSRQVIEQPFTTERPDKTDDWPDTRLDSAPN